MTREEFIGVLEKKGYSYNLEGNKIVVTRNSGVYLGSLKTLPSGVEFENGGDVYLGSLETLPPGVEFKNGGYVNLESLKTLPPGVEFKNGWYVDLRSLETLPSGVEFKNEGPVDLRSLIGGFFNKWDGNIDGVEPKRLLNKMISMGMFDRR